MQTSPTVKKFLISLGLISLIIALLQTYLNSDLGGLSPQWLLSLNLNGLSKGFIWQPFTYLFTASHGFQGVSLGLILELLANIYLLWMLSLQILQHFDEKHFFRCFLIILWVLTIKLCKARRIAMFFSSLKVVHVCKLVYCSSIFSIFLGISGMNKNASHDISRDSDKSLR